MPTLYPVFGLPGLFVFCGKTSLFVVINYTANLPACVMQDNRAKR